MDIFEFTKTLPEINNESLLSPIKNGFYINRNSSITIKGIGGWGRNTIFHFKNGKVHNDNGPAIITHPSNLNLSSTVVAYLKNGLYHHPTEAAVYRLRGKANLSCFFIESNRIYFSPDFLDGSIVVEEYYFDHLRHRIDGPAIIDNVLEKHEYFIEGKKINGKKEFLKDPRVVLFQNKKKLKEKLSLLK